MVSSAQYITELICERKAIKDNKDLHYRFWLSKEWSSFFKNQIATAHKLLKQYSDKAIINALLTKQGQKIFSLRAPHLPAMIEQQEVDLSKQNTIMTKEIDRKQDKSYSQHNAKNKNIISRLKELE